MGIQLSKTAKQFRRVILDLQDGARLPWIKLYQWGASRNNHLTVAARDWMSAGVDRRMLQNLVQSILQVCWPKMLIRPDAGPVTSLCPQPQPADL